MQNGKRSIDTMTYSIFVLFFPITSFLSYLLMRQIKTKIRYVGDVHLRCPNMSLLSAIPYYVQLRALCLRLFDDYDETSGSQRYRALDDNAKIVLVLSGLDRVRSSIA